MSVRILVVDDEPDLEPLILQRFRRQIKSGEMHFVFAHDGVEALEKLNSDPDIELVLSDINMPVMDGLTLLAKLNEMPRLLKTVMVSAYNDLLNLRVAMNRGAYDFVTKPIDFEDLEATVRKTFRELEALREARRTRNELDEIQAELGVAAKIQQLLLPEPISVHADFDVAAIMLPARQVSGDFYDFFQIDEIHLGFVLGDVSGKGIPAALFMAVARTVLRSTALSGASPRECLQVVNRVLAPQGRGQMYVTLFYGILDLSSGSLLWTVGGHSPPWLLPASGPPRQLEGPRGFLVGMFPEADFDTTEVMLQRGDTILVHTDGITDAANPAGETFGKARLNKLLLETHSNAVGHVVERIVEGVVAFTSHAPQADDITLLVFRFGRQS
ncbi:MAG: SpoIIE family protein phosphatase [Terriglobia bacterium]